MALQMSPDLTARFERLQNAYPVKRSALIPMLMYAQDEFGHISDEVIAEIAARLELRTVQVEETLEYYLMLHRKPMGKYHVQVCTNVACMLRGGNELLDRAKKRLEIGHKEVTKDGIFSLEEVECIGACTGAPALQINYDFYENLTPLTFDRLIQELDYGRKAEPVSVISGALHPREPGEIPVISKRWGIENSTKIDVFLQNGGYQALDKALEIAQTIAANGPLSVEAILKTLHETQGMSAEDGFEYESAYASKVMGSQDAVEGPRAFAEKRTPNFKGR